MTALDLESVIVQAAQRDPVVFNDFVLRDEETHAPITTTATQAEWHKLLGQLSEVQFLTHVDSGKTQQISIGRVLWELGRNPALRVVIVSRTERLVTDICKSIAHYIETSAELRRVFPHLQRAAGETWNQTELVVSRTSSAKDPSVRAVSVHGSVLGARADLVILDDIVGLENSGSQALRNDLDRWIRSTLLGRSAKRIWVLGNPWHRDDQHHRFEQDGWPTYRYPVEANQRSRWPERWPESKIANERRRMGPREAARQLDVIPPDEADAIFKTEWVLAALVRGAHASTEYLASAVERGAVVTLGCDPAYGMSDRADLRALVLMRSRSDGTREVTQVQAGRWSFDELVSRIVNVCKMHRAVACIESNAGGEYVCQQVEKHVATLRLPTTAQNRRAKISMLESELSAGRISFRQSGELHPEMKALTEEILAYDEASHMGDRLAALLAALVGIRQREQRRQGRFLNLDTLTR